MLLYLKNLYVPTLKRGANHFTIKVGEVMANDCQ